MASNFPVKDLIKLSNIAYRNQKVERLDTWHINLHPHKTRLKGIVNPILRVLQFWTNRPFVIYSIMDIHTNHDPNSKELYLYTFNKYGFGQVAYTLNHVGLGDERYKYYTEYRIASPDDW